MVGWFGSAYLEKGIRSFDMALPGRQSERARKMCGGWGFQCIFKAGERCSGDSPPHDPRKAFRN